MERHVVPVLGYYYYLRNMWAICHIFPLFTGEDHGDRMGVVENDW